MALIRIEDKTHIELKRLALDGGETVKEVGQKAVSIGIKKMRERLEKTLAKKKTLK